MNAARARCGAGSNESRRHRDLQLPRQRGRRRTSTIPIVIFSAGEPVKTHLVDSFNRPGGNITGISDVLQNSRRNGLDY